MCVTSHFVVVHRVTRSDMTYLSTLDHVSSICLIIINVDNANSQSGKRNIGSLHLTKLTKPPRPYSRRTSAACNVSTAPLWQPTAILSLESRESPAQLTLTIGLGLNPKP
jgi:hypothetical protein